MSISNLREKLQNLFEGEWENRFSTGKHFGVTTKAANGVTYWAGSELQNGKLTGKIAAKYDVDGLSVENVSLDNSGTLRAVLKLADAADDTTFGLNVCLEPLASSGESEKTELTAEYAKDALTASLTVSPVEDLYAVAGVQYDASCNFTAAGEGTIRKDDTGVSLSDYALALAYKEGDSQALAVLEDKLQKLTLSFHRKHSDSLFFGAEYTTAIAKSDNPVAAVQFGAEYTVDADSSYAFKLTAPTNTTAGASAAVNYNTKLSGSTEFDMNAVLDLSGNKTESYGVAFGAKLGFTA